MTMTDPYIYIFTWGHHVFAYSVSLAQRNTQSHRPIYIYILERGGGERKVADNHR